MQNKTLIKAVWSGNIGVKVWEFGKFWWILALFSFVGSVFVPYWWVLSCVIPVKDQELGLLYVCTSYLEGVSK